MVTIISRRPARCPDRKIQFQSREEAENVAADLTDLDVFETILAGGRVAAYHCEKCGAWHITEIPAGEPS